MRKMIRSNGSTVMELPDTTPGIPLVLACSIKIRSGGNLEVLLDCTRQLTNQMDIRFDTGFHHKNPNIYIPPSCINNPNNKYNPKYMPLTIFNLSTVVTITLHWVRVLELKQHLLHHLVSTNSLWYHSGWLRLQPIFNY